MATATAWWTPVLRRLIPRSLRSRLLLTYLVLMVLGLGSLILWTGLRLQFAAIEQAEHDLELESLIIANALREPLEKWGEGTGKDKEDNGRPLDTLVRSYAQSAGARVTVIDPTLQVLLSSDEAVPAHLEHNHPEIVAAQSGRELHDIRWDEWQNEQRLFVAAPVLAEEGRLEAVVQLSVRMAPIYAEIQSTWMSLVVAGGVALGATVLVSLLLARQVADPIRNLTIVTEEMAAGNLDQQVNPAGPDEIERLGRAFNRMAERVREMLARQQTFVADAAHELRSPLTSLRLRIELLQRHSRDNPDLAQRYLFQMEREVEHLRRLVEHLLILSSVDEGQAQPRLPLDLAPILYDLADEMGPLVQATGLRLQVDVPPHLPTVAAHADSMRMVVRNLLDNALKYTPPGGQVTLRATDTTAADRRRSAAETPATGRRQPSAVMIEVIDTGLGIPADALPHIFERFYRADKARSRAQSGAGLGLSIVKAIIEAHGGQVSAESTPGQGTRVWFTLPVETGGM